jgi:uncharacterized protein (TIGR02611 family)
MSTARALTPGREQGKVLKSMGPWVRMIRPVKRVVAAVIGGAVTLAGIALIVLPGPAFIVIPIGLAILATEFDWAKDLLKKARKVASRLKGKLTRRT